MFCYGPPPPRTCRFQHGKTPKFSTAISCVGAVILLFDFLLEGVNYPDIIATLEYDDTRKKPLNRPAGRLGVLAFHPISAKFPILTEPSGKRAITSSSPPIASTKRRRLPTYISVRFSILATAA